jgi:hypothetical protein
MSISAVSSALTGLSGAQSQFDVAAAAAARVTSVDPSDPAAAATSDVVGAIVGTTVSSQAVAINIAVLDAALENERSLIDILA